MRQQQFILDGEAVVLGVDGLSDFDALQSRRHDDEVQLYAFDCLALGGDGLSRLPLFMRKTNLAQLEKDPQRSSAIPYACRNDVGAQELHAAGHEMRA
ncbi:ATP-dependent DNA ligase [Bradyrhizobium sp. CCBAU 11386]|uniref:ATP-dependent DNA ligase n=1 Tax=Bradyrhizobium sp. CCBAU 11386 TaxID=1630837 RepID=UPI002FE27A63